MRWCKRLVALKQNHSTVERFTSARDLLLNGLILNKKGKNRDFSFWDWLYRQDDTPLGHVFFLNIFKRGCWSLSTVLTTEDITLINRIELRSSNLWLEGKIRWCKRSLSMSTIVDNSILNATGVHEFIYNICSRLVKTHDLKYSKWFYGWPR